MPELFDEFGMPLAIGDTVLVAGEIGVVGKIEAFELGGVVRDDSHRVLVSNYPFYVRPCNLIKLAVLPEYTP